MIDYLAVVVSLVDNRQILIYLSNRIKYNAPKRINAWGQNFYMGIRLMVQGDFLCLELAGSLVWQQYRGNQYREM